MAQTETEKQGCHRIFVLSLFFRFQLLRANETERERLLFSYYYYLLICLFVSFFALLHCLFVFLRVFNAKLWQDRVFESVSPSFGDACDNTSRSAWDVVTYCSFLVFLLFFSLFDSFFFLSARFLLYVFLLPQFTPLKKNPKTFSYFFVHCFLASKCSFEAGVASKWKNEQTYTHK